MNSAAHGQKNPAKITTPMTVPHMAVQRKCGCGGSAGLTGKCTECQNQWLAGKPVQTKLRINEPGDAYEQEADRVAEQVMRMAEPNQDSDSSRLGATTLVQRRIADEGGESTTMSSARKKRQKGSRRPRVFRKPRVERTRKRAVLVRVGVKIRRVSASGRRKITCKTI